MLHERPNAPPVGVSPVDPATAAFSALLRVEAEARGATRVADLLHLAVNETRALLRARQVFILRRGATGGYRIVAASSLPAIDASAPAVHWLEQIVARLVAHGPTKDGVTFVAHEHADAGDPWTATYPFQQMQWVPLWSRHLSFSAGFLLVRETPWLSADRAVALRLAMTFGHAWSLLESPLPLRQRWSFRGRRWLCGATLVAGVLAVIPVPMTALAPVEITARGALTVAMPVDGQIQDVLVAPSTRVEAGTLLVRLVDTHARNKLDIAEREMAIADSRFAKSNQLAIADMRGRHELGIARAELALRVAERDYAREMLRKLEITAPASGVALFADKKDLIGRPLATGDRLMEIADPQTFELKIEVPVSDAILMKIGVTVKAFMDADPLRPIAATVTRFDYQARVNDTRIAVHRVFAAVDPEDKRAHRLGVRGTAQIYGAPTMLGDLLLRRPITAARQWLGL